MIGVFDSGLGGLTILKSLIEALPNYDYLYLGDVAHLPYGDKSQETIHELTQKSVDFLFQKGCPLIILACHTASAQALRKIQQEYLIQNYPKRRVLGVTIPLCETVVEQLSPSREALRVGVLATQATCSSGSFEKEFKKLNPKIEVFCQPAPLLVPIIEEGRLGWEGLDLCLKEYLSPLLKKEVSVLVLGCTHYPLIKNKIKKILKGKIEIVSTDEILAPKLQDYLQRHPEIEGRLSKRGERTYLVTDFNPYFREVAARFFGKEIPTRVVRY